MERIILSIQKNGAGTTISIRRGDKIEVLYLTKEIEPEIMNILNISINELIKSFNLDNTLVI